MATRKLNEMEARALDLALQGGTSVADLAKQYGESNLAKGLQETGLRLPGADAAKLTDPERKLYIDTITSGKDLMSVLTSTGITPTAALERLQQTQLYVPLSQEHQQVFDWASSNKISAAELAASSGTPLENINTVLGAAGLTLPGGEKTGTTTQLPGMDSNYPGGLPREQTRGGMYGFSAEGVSMNPALLGARRQAKRRADPNYRGQTDTILTGGQGVLGDANTQVKTLLGA